MSDSIQSISPETDTNHYSLTLQKEFEETQTEILKRQLRMITNARTTKITDFPSKLYITFNNLAMLSQDGLINPEQPVSRNEIMEKDGLSMTIGEKEVSIRTLEGEKSLGSSNNSSPLHKAFLTELNNLKLNTDKHQLQQLSPFKNDPVSTLMFILNITNITTPDILHQVTQQSLKSIANDLLVQILSNNKYLTKQADGTLAVQIPLKIPGVYISLVPNTNNQTQHILDTEWAMQLKIDPSVVFGERANQAPYIHCESFINRPTGLELARILDSCGMRFSDTFESFITTQSPVANFDDRYGGPYTEISRLIAKVIHRRDITKLEDIFTQKNDEHLSITDLLSFANIHTTDPGVIAIQKIFKQFPKMLRTSVQTISTQEIQIKDGACFDSFGYFLDAYERGQTEIINI